MIISGKTIFAKITYLESELKKNQTFKHKFKIYKCKICKNIIPQKNNLSLKISVPLFKLPLPGISLLTFSHRNESFLLNLSSIFNQ